MKKGGWLAYIPSVEEHTQELTHNQETCVIYVEEQRDLSGSIFSDVNPL